MYITMFSMWSYTWLTRDYYKNMIYVVTVCVDNNAIPKSLRYLQVRQMQNVSGCTISDEILIHREEKSISADRGSTVHKLMIKLKGVGKKRLISEQSDREKRRSHESNGGDTSDQVERENKK